MDNIIAFMPFNEDTNDYTGTYTINTSQTNFVDGIKSQKQLNVQSIQQAYIENPDFITLNEFSIFCYINFKKDGNIISFYNETNKYFRLFYENSFKISIKDNDTFKLLDTLIEKPINGYMPIIIIFKQFKDYDGALCLNVQGKKFFYKLSEKSRFTSSNCDFRFGQYGTPIEETGRNDISVQNFIVFSKQLGDDEQEQLINKDYKKSQDTTYTLNGQKVLKLTNIEQPQNLSFVEIFDKDEKNIQIKD